jgi:hypothetical protein
MSALKDLLALEKSTSKAKPFSEWESYPKIHFETDDAAKYYNPLPST